MSRIFLKEELISPALLEIIQNNSDQPEIDEQLFYKVSYIAHRHFKINLIYVDKSIVGYYIWKSASGYFLKGFPDIQSFSDVLEDNKEYFFLTNFEIFKRYRNRGYGTKIMSNLKREQALKGNEILILTDHKSERFWNKICPECKIFTLHGKVDVDDRTRII